MSEHKTSCHSGKAGTNNYGSYHAYKKANSYYEMVKRENLESDDLPEDLVHCPECAKPVKAKAIVIHFRRAHGRLPPGRKISDPKCAATLLTRYYTIQKS